MVQGLDIPTAGCWEITGHYKNQKLRFVIWVTGGAILPTVLGPASLRTPLPTTGRRIRVDGSLQASALTDGFAQRAVTIKDAHVSGTVVLNAVISREGKIDELEPIAGPLPLFHPAMDAVKQWRYKPTFLDGQPVEVDTTIDVVSP
jgi:protein TonB